MNKNKLFFLGFSIIIGILVLIVFSLIRSNDKKTVTSSTLDIWTIGHSSTEFPKLLSQFEDARGVTGNVEFNHRNFESYDDYSTALLYELASGDGPDIFMLNNSESLFLENRISAISPNYINPEDFRKNFISPFPEELIETITDPNDEKKSIDVLVGVPAGFETLGLFYDRRSFIGQDLKTWSGLGKAIEEIKERNPRSVPLGIGHGSTVYASKNIFTQFLINNGSRSLNDLDVSVMKSSLAGYNLYFGEDGNNDYASLVPKLEALGKNNISLFSSGEIKMLIGFPSMLDQIKKSGFSKSFLSAEPFPKSTGTEDRLLLDYHYFVINNRSDDIASASNLLAYLTTQEGATNYYNIFTNKIPAHSLITQKLDQKFDEDFNITYKDLLRDKIELVSYNKGLKNIYDTYIPLILDSQTAAVGLFQDLQTNISCKIIKINGTAGENPSCK